MVFHFVLLKYSPTHIGMDTNIKSLLQAVNYYEDNFVMSEKLNPFLTFVNQNSSVAQAPGCALHDRGSNPFHERHPHGQNYVNKLSART